MSKCLFCYQELENSALHYHVACAKKVFGLSELPVLNFSNQDITEMAYSVINQQITVPGVQKKLSLNIDAIHPTQSRVTIVGLKGNYILKPPYEPYPFMPETEDVSMHLAEIAGIQVVPHSLIPLKDGTLCYITKRIDRTKDGGKLAMEDFCQLCERPSNDKYKGSHEQIAKKINEYSSIPFLDLVNYWEIVIFSWIIGNSDMHLKNFSLISHSYGNYQLASAYDLLSVKLVNPSDDEELALPVQGKKKKIQKKHFIASMKQSKLSDKAIENIFNKFHKVQHKWEKCIDQSFMPTTYKEQLKALIMERLERLK